MGNRVSVFDLVKLVTILSNPCLSIKLTHSFRSNKSLTLPFQNRKNIAAIALDPNGNILISVDQGAVNHLANFSSHRPHLCAVMIQMGGLSSSTSVGVLFSTISISKNQSTPSNSRTMGPSLLSHTNRTFRSGKHRTTSSANSRR